MSLYSSNYLKNLSRNKTLNESTKLFSAREKRYTQFDIFIAHSFLDKDEVEGLYLELTNMGYSVYVDWIIDPHLDRSNVTKETATLIRNRLKISKSLLLAISTSATLSKWIPWELGYVDGNTNNCAIIPVSKSAVPPQSFERLEYLTLYPYVQKPSIPAFQNRLFTIEGANEYVPFANWINGTKPYYQANRII